MSNLTEILFTVVQMSADALIVAITILLVLFPISFIRKIPKRVSYTLMFVVLFRMACPISIASPISIMNFEPLVEYGEKVTTASLFKNDPPIGDYNVAIEGSPEFDEAIASGLTPDKNNDLKFDYIDYNRDESGNMIPAKTFVETYGELCAKIWIAGIVVFWSYGIVTYIHLKRRVSTATIVQDNIYESDRIKTAFVLGFFSPKIYLPLAMNENERKYVICHEQMHIKFGDHFIKAIVFLLMSIHWFNFLLWLWFYRLFMILMEHSCDESVLHKLGADSKEDYSEALFTMSSSRHFIGSIPVAFGECYVKDRIHEILKYKKPAVFLTAIAIIACLGIVAVSATDAIVYDKTMIKFDDNAYNDTRTETFIIAPGQDVNSASFSFEIWTDEGLYYAQKIIGGNLKYLDLSGKENKLTVKPIYSIGNNDNSIAVEFTINDTSTFRTDTIILPLNDELSSKASSPIGYKAPYYSKSDSDIVLMSMVFAPSNIPTGAKSLDCEGMSTSGDVHVEGKNIVVLLRMQISKQYSLPALYDPQSIIPWIKNIDKAIISTHSESAAVDAKEYADYISALDYSNYFYLGNATLEFEADTISIELFSGDNYATIYLGKKEFYISVNTSGQDTQLYRIIPDDIKYKQLLMTVYSKLGISYTPAEVFGLPQEIGSSAFFNGHDTMLLYNFPEVDVSIYGYTWSDNSTWVMLRDGEEIFTTNLEYKLVPDTIVKAIYGNFDLQSSNDNEIIFIAKSTDAQLSCGFDHMIYVAYWSDGDLEIQGLYDYGLQMNNLVSLGEYVDRPDLIYIFYEGYNIAGNLLYEKDEISVDITEYINSGYEEYKLADFCSSDVYFHLDNGKISCSLGIYLEFKDMADHVQIGIAEATISYSKEAAGLTFEDVTLKNLE